MASEQVLTLQKFEKRYKRKFGDKREQGGPETDL